MGCKVLTESFGSPEPGGRAGLDLMGVETAAELAGITASVGLVSNLAAIAAEGIQVRPHEAPVEEKRFG
jgi:hypothetical protein